MRMMAKMGMKTRVKKIWMTLRRSMGRNYALFSRIGEGLRVYVIDILIIFLCNNEANRLDQGVAEHGVIEYIEMTQFMCHKLLKFHFGPQINFIIGAKR